MSKTVSERLRPCIASQSFSIEASAGSAGIPISVTLAWMHHGSPHGAADRAAASERMKRLDAAVDAFLDVLYAPEGEVDG